MDEERFLKIKQQIQKEADNRNCNIALRIALNCCETYNDLLSVLTQAYGVGAESLRDNFLSIIRRN